MPADTRPRYGTARYGQARYTSRTSLPPTPPVPHPKSHTTRSPMSDLTVNRLNMIDASLRVARSAEHRPVWENQEPLDFGVDLAALGTAYDDALALAQRASTTLTGTADEKALAETTLENTTHRLARALAVHFRKTGDLANRAKVNLRLGAIQKLRDQILLTRAREIRDLGQTASTEPGAAGRGVTAARVTALTAAIDAFAPYVNAARGEIVNRSALLRDLETDVAALVEDITELDDLVLQFDSEAGERFQTAWTAARQIIDAGHRSSGEEEEPPSPASPTP